jgi:hypothetical protein
MPDYEPERLLALAAELEKPLEIYLKWKVICDRYERGKTSALANQISIIRGTDATASHASLESKALASDGFKKYLEEWHEAEKQKVSAQVKYENLKCQLEALQSYLAYKREEMRNSL